MSSDGINSITTNFASASSLNTRDLDPLIKLISSRLGVSESTAFSVLRKFMGTANANTFSDIQEFMTKFLEQGNPRQINELANDLQNLQNDPKTQAQNYKPIISRLQYALAQNKTPVNPQQIADQDRFVASSQAKAANTNPSTQLVQSPKLFASWLVNNKAAFLTLRSNPTTTNLLLALQNPEINKSPMMLSQIAILISQLLKLKAGKSLTEDVDEVKKGELGERSRAESADHEANIVNYVKASAATTKVTALRDFLLEAERFAEEEIANIWSLTLKKEKELEKKLKAGFEKFNNSQGRKNPKK